MRALLFFSTVFAASVAAEELPAHFVAHRVYLVPRTPDGHPVNFFLDSGGGGSSLCRSVSTQLHYVEQPVHDEELESFYGHDVSKIDWPKFDPHTSIPPPAIGDTRLVVHRCNENDAMLGIDEGFLSSRWLDGRVWTWDYPRGIFRREESSFRPDANAQRVPIHFKVSADGKHHFAMIRFTVTIDGKPLDLLLDTGATTTLTPEALASIHDALPAMRATSFIDDSVFNAWHKAHPDWRVIENAEVRSEQSMIAVPFVDIGNTRVGPVWFTHRPDSAFREWMSQMTDKTIDGALGGDAFYHYVMTVDYPNKVAYFRCVEDCAPIKPKSVP